MVRLKILFSIIFLFLLFSTFGQNTFYKKLDYSDGRTWISEPISLWKNQYMYKTTASNAALYIDFQVIDSSANIIRYLYPYYDTISAEDICRNTLKLSNKTLLFQGDVYYYTPRKYTWFYSIYDSNYNKIKQDTNYKFQFLTESKDAYLLGWTPMDSNYLVKSSLDGTPIWKKSIHKLLNVSTNDSIIYHLQMAFSTIDRYYFWLGINQEMKSSLIITLNTKGELITVDSFYNKNLRNIELTPKGWVFIYDNWPNTNTYEGLDFDFNKKWSFKWQDTFYHRYASHVIQNNQIVFTENISLPMSSTYNELSIGNLFKLDFDGNLLYKKYFRILNDTNHSNFTHRSFKVGEISICEDGGYFLTGRIGSYDHDSWLFIIFKVDSLLLGKDTLNIENDFMFFGLHDTTLLHFNSIESQNINQKAFVYPNPIRDKCKFEIQNQQDEISTFSMINTKGQKIYTTRFKGNHFDLERKSIKSGLYIYQIINSKRIYTGKLILK